VQRQHAEEESLPQTPRSRLLVERKHCGAAHRLSPSPKAGPERARNSSNLQPCSDAYRAARKAIKKAIRSSKKECFLKLCDDVEQNPWGGAYRKVVKRVSAGNGTPSDPEVLEGIVRALFPEGQPLTSPSSIASGEICPVNEQEVLGIARSLHNRKAPGPDAIP
ncbi:hypothetical protein KR032_010070, partial [Drosophila birchii]